MKWGILILSSALFGCMYVLSSTGLAVHRTHAISVTTGLVTSGKIPQSEFATVEQQVLSVGNADFYYRTISNVAGLGCAANGFCFVYYLWVAKRKPR